MKTTNKYQTTNDRQEFTSVKWTIDNGIQFKMIKNHEIQTSFVLVEELATSSERPFAFDSFPN